MKLNKTDMRRWLSFYLLILAGIVSFAIINNREGIFKWLETLVGHLSPFMAGAIIAYLLDIPCSALERMMFISKSRFVRKHARGIAVFATFLIVIVVITIFLLIVIPEVAASIQEFATLLPMYTSNVIRIAEDFIQNEEIIEVLGLQYELQAFINEITFMQVFDIIGQTVADTLMGFISGIFSAANFIMQALIAAVSAIYLLLGAQRMKQFIISLITSFVSPKTSSVFFRYVGNANQYLKSFINCSIVDSIIIGLITLIGLMIMQASYSVVFSIIMGFTNLIPFFGPLVGAIIIGILVLIADDMPTSLAVVLFLFVLQQIDGNIIRVKLFGDAFKISPFLVIFSITIGGAYYGILGMVFAIPLVAVLKVILDDILDYRKKARSMDNRL